MIQRTAFERTCRECKKVVIKNGNIVTGPVLAPVFRRTKPRTDLKGSLVERRMFNLIGLFK